MAVNIDGNGLIALGGTSSTQGRLRLAEDTDNGTNYIELTAPASVGSDRVITFPDATTTVVGTDTTQTLTNKSIVATQLTGTIAAARLPAGSVLQVVSTTKTDTFSASTTSGSSHAVTGLTVSITPSSTNNKIVVFASVATAQNNADTNQGVFCILTRGGSAISGAIGGADGNRIRSTSNTNQINRYTMATLPILYLDSPASTSSLTYGVEVGNNLSGSGTVFVNRVGDDVNASNVARAASTITVMEIAG